MKFSYWFLSSLGFLLVLFFLVLWKVRPYNYELSALIGIWEGFAQLNKDYIPTGFVVFQDGGYDGQFFFFLSRYLIESQNLPFPILDSFYFRYHRIALSWIGGLGIYFFTPSKYPEWVLFILVFFHLASFIALDRLLPENKKYLGYFYLWNPFSIISINLLVSDSLLVSTCILAYYFLIQSYLLEHKKIIFYLIGLAMFTLGLFVRETSFTLILPILFIYYQSHRKIYLIGFLIPILAYGFFLIHSQIRPIENPGTYPLKFHNMIDFPLFGFLKSLEIPSGFRELLKEGVKFVLFTMYLQLFCTWIWMIGQITKKYQSYLYSLFISLTLILSIITIAEEGYWRNFDNIARMFTLAIPISLIGKKEIPNYKDFGFLYTSLMLTFLVIIRILFITKPMKYILWQ